MTQNQLNKYPSVNSIYQRLQSRVQYFENDDTMPYILKDGLYQYFVQDADKYFYVGMTSLKELGENK